MKLKMRLLTKKFREQTALVALARRQILFTFVGTAELEQDIIKEVLFLIPLIPSSLQFLNSTPSGIRTSLGTISLKIRANYVL